MKYRIRIDVDRVQGWQSFLVEADSKEAALRKHLAGESEYEDEELDVTHLDKPTLNCVKELGK